MMSQVSAIDNLARCLQRLYIIFYNIYYILTNLLNARASAYFKISFIFYFNFYIRSLDQQNFLGSLMRKECSGIYMYNNCLYHTFAISDQSSLTKLHEKREKQDNLIMFRRKLHLQPFSINGCKSMYEECINGRDRHHKY